MFENTKDNRTSKSWKMVFISVRVKPYEMQHLYQYIGKHFIRNIYQRFDPRLLKKNNEVNTFLLKNLE